MTGGALAASFTISGASGALHVLALLCFLIASVVAWFVAPGHRIVLSLISLGLFFFTLATLWS